ncbi:MBL fold metallo-hydrolase [Nostoc sp. LEGE 06077]|uniref:MBL fold metallo-hydrolase n=1 Tax=Nostoc sp. LEGE 06077 TaxID=915325 RepID=UPI00187E53AB|nr:MBL fold metallo-hydrolase [Nostoc sp. LEGE 06077]MBE9208885.1 MBL fold metallo-hydrolase [Nostoc sp. LEGE 06077]
MEESKRIILPADSTPANFDNGSIFFIGTATVLLRYAGFTILTDPNFLHRGDHVHLGYGINSTRLTEPALTIEQLPPLDLVVLSHMHEDHFDHIAAEKVDKNLPIITTHHAATKLKQKGFNSPQPLKTWETLTVTKGDANLCITAMPGIHGPGILKALLPPVMGSMLEFQTPNAETKFRLYITGDTLIHQQLYEIPRRYPNIDLALLHLGGTMAFGILLTMDAKQGVQAIQIIAPRTAIPIHFNDYTVFKSALEDFKKAIVQAGLENKIKYLNHGDTYTFTVA